jgi:hypothetical protein
MLPLGNSHSCTPNSSTCLPIPAQIDSAEIDEARDEVEAAEMEHADMRVHTRESTPVERPATSHPAHEHQPSQESSVTRERPTSSKTMTLSLGRSRSSTCQGPDTDDDRYLASLGHRFEADLRASQDDTAFATSLRKEFSDAVDPSTSVVTKKTRDRMDRSREDREIRLLRERETARLREPQAREATMRREEVSLLSKRCGGTKNLTHHALYTAI